MKTQKKRTENLERRISEKEGGPIIILCVEEGSDPSEEEREAACRNATAINGDPNVLVAFIP